ncbi:FAD-binding protein [Nocardia wallacei]|uniref:FAD-binding protein n=1 Tax=Nocardia wallacei TaxID=480035 RepID=UPI002456E41A|nr:FAD-binding protein [Nocardia wallacei]
MRRRALLAGGSLLGTSLALGAGRAAARPAETADTVIIGSGYAGSVAALRLAEAGHRSVVLERGRRWRITPGGGTFATPERPDGRAAWLPDPRGGAVLSTGVLEAFPAQGIIGLAGAGVGGGSLVNNTVLVAPGEAGFRRALGGILDYREMTEVWYPRARRLLGPAPIPPDVFDAAAYSDARDFADLAARAGYDPVRLDLGVDWPTVRREIAGTAVPSAIAGHSMWGVNSGAKRSVDRTILAAAEATGLTEVRALCPVDSIRLDDNGYRVDYTEITETGAPAARRTLRADRVVLAAGSLGTTGLLVRARAEGWLPGLSPEVGRRWGTGGDHLVALGGFPALSAGQGGPAHVGIVDDSGDVPVTMLGFPLGTTLGGQVAGGVLAVSDPPALGTVRYDAGVVVEWPAQHPALTRIAEAVRVTADRFARARGGASLAVSGAPTTSHSLGGVVFGSATTASGELLGCPNLFVVDSALLPGSCGAVPPALTVTALADRCITTVIERLDH